MRSSTQNMAAISVYSHTKQETAKLSWEIKNQRNHRTHNVSGQICPASMKVSRQKMEGFPWNNWYFFEYAPYFVFYWLTTKQIKDQKQQIQSISFYICMLYCAYAPLVHVQCIKYDLCFSCLLVRSISGCGFMYTIHICNAKETKNWPHWWTTVA